MRRIADAQLRVALPQNVDLVELQVDMRRRILRDARHQREILVAMAHEGDDVVHVGEADAGGGADDRQVGAGDRLEQRPVGEGAAGDLEDVEPVLDDALDRRLVEGRAHGEEARRLDRRDELARRVAIQPRLGEALDVLDVGAALEGRVDERVELAELEFEGKRKLEVARERPEGLDDAQPVREVAHVVVGELEDEERLGEAQPPACTRLIQHGPVQVFARRG